MLLALLMSFILSGTTPLERCSVGSLRANPEGYFWPLEDVRSFVTSADIIVRGRADSVTIRPGVSSQYGPATEVHFTVLELLRGVRPSGLTVVGYFVDNDDFNRGPVPYRMVRPSGQRGECLTYEYRRGAEYLLILREAPPVHPIVPAAEPNGLSPYWAPLAPLNEQVRGANDPWVHWVRSVLEREPVMQGR